MSLCLPRPLCAFRKTENKPWKVCYKRLLHPSKSYKSCQTGPSSCLAVWYFYVASTGTESPPAATTANIISGVFPAAVQSYACSSSYYPATATPAAAAATAACSSCPWNGSLSSDPHPWVCGCWSCRWPREFGNILLLLSSAALLGQGVDYQLFSTQSHFKAFLPRQGKREGRTALTNVNGTMWFPCS